LKIIILADSILNSFKFALDGIRFALKTQRNLHIHLTIAFLVILMSIFLHCSSIEITILVLTINFVISLELINTAIEATIDLVSPHSQPLAKIAKDLGAAAVLISAACSVIIGLIILSPKLFGLIF
jgi:diacylglycerol kinase